MISVLLVTGGSLFGQPGFLALSSGTTTAGGTASLNLNFIPIGSQPAALQWTLNYSPTAVTSVSVVPGAAASAAAKSIFCAGSSGSYICLAAGINSNTIGPGVIATVNVTLAQSTLSTTVGVTGALGATFGGNTYITSGTGGTITVTGSPTYNVTSLSCNPASLGGAAASTCTVAIDNAAPAAGLTISLSSNNQNLTVPASVTVGAGLTSASFTAISQAVSSNQIAAVTAAYGASSQSTILSLTAGVSISSLVCTPSTLGSSATSNCTVTLSAAAGAGGIVVSLSSSGLGALTMPASVMVAATSTAGGFVISTGSLSSTQSGTLTASYGASSQSMNITLSSGTAISSLQCNPTTLGANSSANCIVTLSKAASVGGAIVALSSSGLSALTVPATVLVTPGSTAGPFTVGTGAVGIDQNGTLIATYNGSSQSANMSLTAGTVISSLVCNPTTLGANASSNCAVTLSKPAPAGGAAVSLAATSLPALTVPASVPVTAGSTAGPFTVSAGAITADQNGSLKATFNGSSQSVNMSLASATSISSLVCSPTILGANSSASCTVTLTNAASGAGATVALSSSGLPALSVPANVLVAAGATAGGFTVSTGNLSSDQNGTITASYSSTSQTVNMSLAAAASVIVSLVCSPTTLGADATGNCTVTMSKAAPSGGLTVTLSTAGLPSLLAPPSVAVAGGSTAAAFTVSTGSLSANQSGTLTATYNSVSQSVPFTLSASAVISSLVCSPTTLGPFATSNCTVTLSAPASVATSVALSSNLPGVAVPRIVVVQAGATAGGFTISTFAVAANASGTVTAAYNASSQTVTINLTAQ